MNKITGGDIVKNLVLFMASLGLCYYIAFHVLFWFMFNLVYLDKVVLPW